MNLKPLHDRLVVKPIEAEEKSAGGILIPDNAKEKPTKGEVLAVGEGKALVNEAKEACAQVKEARKAAKAKGGKGRYCPPKKPQRMSSDEFYDRIAAIPAAERARIDMVEAMNRMLERKHPCPR